MYQLVFLDDLATKYHVMAYFREGKASFSSIKAQSGAKGHEKLPKLVQICQSPFGSAKAPRLFSGDY